MATQYMSCADTAKMIRQALKEAFPDVKFSVRSKTYSGGASIDVSWTDGPNTNQVEAIAKTFSGGYFDGMTDYKGCTYSMLEGQVVRFGADFVFCNRRFSDASIQRAIDRFYTKFVGNFNQYGLSKPTVEQFNKGELWSTQIFWQGVPYNENVQSGINAMLYKASDRLKVESSKTAGRVIYLGNDGYSDVAALSTEAVE